MPRRLSRPELRRLAEQKRQTERLQRQAAENANNNNHQRYHRCRQDGYDYDDEDTDDDMRYFFQRFFSGSFFGFSGFNFHSGSSSSSSDSHGCSSSWKDKKFYQTLGLEKSASIVEIKKAYKEKALQCHPDRFVGASSEQLLQCEETFKMVNEAYRVLTDVTKRRQYDSECGYSDDEY
jgi:hypothetical protein